MITLDLLTRFLKEHPFLIKKYRLESSRLVTFDNKISIIQHRGMDAKNVEIVVWSLINIRDRKSTMLRMLSFGSINVTYTSLLIIDNNILLIREPRFNPNIFT